MKRFLLIPNANKDVDLSVSRRVCRVLHEAGGTVYVAEPLAAHMQDAGAVAYAEDNFPKDAELILTIGGDGTVLDSSRMAIREEIPMLGINLGRLGYLAEVEPNDVESLACLCTDRTFHIEERLTLSVTLHHNGCDWELPRLSVNDVVFYRASLGHATDLTISHGERGGVRYLGDGLILSTPTGSTAYSLSAGGAIMDLSVDAICATPICPHSFFNRSLIFGTEQSVRVTNTSEQDAVTVTLDGKENLLLEAGDYVTVSRGLRSLRILSLNERDFIENLHLKMKVSE